ncbi:MAG: hypothetical protein KDA48_04090, partial [Amphiplicatus sp.]|nr:hypothetical protein [Amphiplicatus sp.]
AAALFWRHSEATKNLSNDPWSALVGFRLNKPAKSVYWIELDGAPAIARLVEKAEGFDVTIEPSATAAIRREGGASGEPFTFSFGAEKIGDDFRITQGGAQLTAAAVRHGEGLRVFIGANAVDIAFPDPLSGALGHHSAEGSLTAPMPGVITLLKAAPGDSVEAGATLLVMEAMKMEHAIKAPHDGVIKSFRFKAGDQVKDGDLLVEFEESA